MKIAFYISLALHLILMLIWTLMDVVRFNKILYFVSFWAVPINAVILLILSILLWRAQRLKFAVVGMVLGLLTIIGTLISVYMIINM